MMSTFYRKPRADIAELHTARLNIILGPDQQFMETPKAFEIWEDVGWGELVQIKRIPKTKVLWEMTY